MTNQHGVEKNTKQQSITYQCCDNDHQHFSELKNQKLTFTIDYHQLPRIQGLKSAQHQWLLTPVVMHLECGVCHNGYTRVAPRRFSYLFGGGCQNPTVSLVLGIHGISKLDRDAVKLYPRSGGHCCRSCSLVDWLHLCEGCTGHLKVGCLPS